MEMILLGTGCPVVNLERYGPATLVRHGESSVLVDCGSGVTQRLLEAGTPGREIDGLLLTHLHSDHIVDLFQLVISSWHQGRPRPQRVFGPPGTKRYVDGLMKLWRPELEQRIAHEMRSSTAALEVEVTEFGDGWTTAFGDLDVEAVEVDHKPVEHAYGFVFRAAGNSLVISGDTRPCEALARAARGVDLLLHEVFIHGEMAEMVEGRTVEGIERVASYHTVSTEVGKLADEAGVGCLVLTHFVPPHCDREALLDEVRQDFAGPLVVGEDLMRLDLATAVLRYRDLVLGLEGFAGDATRPDS
ncbi:MAG: MBL fold metallo-hydrolase [Alphaproteobacteria bacterium]|nr:MBL fold metallo-hydrolase [Alphaproteobacteria bacterium]